MFFTLNQHLTELVIKRLKQQCDKTVNIISNDDEDHNDPPIKSKDHCENSLHKTLTIILVSFNIRPHFLDMCAQKAVLPGQQQPTD